jgi:hypothetical protein
LLRKSESPSLGIFSYHFRGIAWFSKLHYLQLDNSPTNRYRNSLRPVAGTQLLHNVLDMNFDCLFRDEQSFCDVPVPVSTGDVLQNVYFATGQELLAQMFC